MLSKRAQQEILDLALEDCTPLFDVANIAKAGMPSRPVDEQVEAARLVVRHLLSKGYVKLYYDCLAKSSENYRHIEELTPSEADTELSSQVNWLYHDRKAPDQRWVTIVATPAAEKALLDGEFFAG